MNNFRKENDLSDYVKKIIMDQFEMQRE